LVQLSDLLVQHLQQSQQIFSPACRPGLQWKLAQQLLSRLAPQLVFALHSLIQGKVLQFVFYPAANHHQLVPVQHQLAQIALLPVRHPQPRKPALLDQLANMLRIPLVGFLLAHITGPDLRRISDPDRVPKILDQLDEPLAIARGLHADQHWRLELPIELLGLAAGMHQLPLAWVPTLSIQPVHLLPAGMEITSYNHHCEGSFLSEKP
jgi:hypothetical protein